MIKYKVTLFMALIRFEIDFVISTTKLKDW